MNKENNTVSVVVPVYKVEEYLDACVQSLVEQTHKELQIILVDDGSPDSCGDMCDEWAKKDDRITVIHKENGGLSDARNAGVKLATGSFIYFVDSDDTLANNAIEKAVSSIIKYDADVVISTHKSVDNSGEVKVLTGDEMFQQIFRNWCWEAWGKLYKASLVAVMSFQKGKIYEDIAYTPYVMLKAKKAVYIDDGAYHYTIRDDSIMGKSKAVIRVDLVEHIEALLDYLKANHKNQVNFFLNWSILFLCKKYLSITDFNANRGFVTAVNSFYRKNKVYVWLMNNYGLCTRRIMIKVYWQIAKQSR